MAKTRAKKIEHHALIDQKPLQLAIGRSPKSPNLRLNPIGIVTAQE
jgi:hypothetical protein